MQRALIAPFVCAHRAGVAFCPTDASMLPPLEQKPAEQQQRRRRRRGAESDDDEEDAASEEEGSEREKQPRQHKRGKPRGEGGSGRKQGRRDRR